MGVDVDESGGDDQSGEVEVTAGVLVAQVTDGRDAAARASRHR